MIYEFNGGPKCGSTIEFKTMELGDRFYRAVEKECSLVWADRESANDTWPVEVYEHYPIGELRFLGVRK